MGRAAADTGLLNAREPDRSKSLMTTAECTLQDKAIGNRRIFMITLICFLHFTIVELTEIAKADRTLYF